MIVLDLVQNLALLVALAALFQRIGARVRQTTLRRRILSGLLFGAVGVVGMATPVRLLPGIIFDGRSVILAVAGIFGGPVVAGTAALACAAYRLALGGAGTVMGLAVIVEAATLGAAAETVRRRRGWPRGARFFVAVGVLVHVAMLVSIVALPGWAGPSVMLHLGPSILLLYPLATVSACLLFQDFEEQARGRAALRESEARYRDLFLAHPLPMWVCDLETLRFLAVNDATVDHYGYSREELLTMTVRDIWPADDHLPMEADAARARPDSGEEERPGRLHRARDGRVFEVELASHDITFEGRRGRVTVAHDVSERRRLEGQLRQAQKMKAVGTLAGGIAHDFNNLLQAMLSAVQAARLQAGSLPTSSPVLERTLGEIEAQVRRGAQLTRQILLFSRQTPAEWQTVDLAALIVEQSSMLRRVLPETITLRVEPGNRPLPVEGDAGQLSQVLANLVVNARDAMPAGGTVAVSTEARGDDVIVSVRDTGTGMSDEVRDRIFDPFYSTKAPGKGTGLGLAVVWGIVKEHGGRIEVKSEVGRGSTFQVLLPRGAAARPGAARAPVEMSDAIPVGHNERILLVEDEEGARRGLTELLSMLSYRVTAVASSEEATAVDGAAGFDILLTDFRLPGASGLELARSLSARWPGLQVVVMSGYAPDELARDLFAGGAVHFLQKPFDVAVLARVLRHVLEAGATPDP